MRLRRVACRTRQRGANRTSAKDAGDKEVLHERSLQRVAEYAYREVYVLRGDVFQLSENNFLTACSDEAR